MPRCTHADTELLIAGRLDCRLIVEVSQGDGNSRRESRQSISLMADEWTSYSVNSPVARPCSVVIRARATTLPAALTFYFNRQKDEIALNGRGWTDVKSKIVNAVPGINRIELRVKSGTILIDWVDVK